MAITDKTRKIIWARSGNRCSICKTLLVLEKDPFNRHLNIGEECHIVSRQVNGPRHQTVVGLDYDDSDNLLLLCCNDHKMVDEKIEIYSAAELGRIKLEHEHWVQSNLGKVKLERSESNESERVQGLLNFVTAKYDIEMNIKKSKQIFQSEEGLRIAINEIGAIRTRTYEIVKLLKSNATKSDIRIRDNRNHMCDIMVNGFTLLIQFYQAYGNIAEDSYLLLAIINGYFNADGSADPFHPPTIREIMRLNFSFDEKGNFGWRDQEKDADFYLSTDILEIWIDKFFKIALEKFKNSI